jgi:hypothetical protein
MYIDRCCKVLKQSFVPRKMVARRQAHIPGRGSGGCKARPCTWKWKWWLPGQPMYLEGGAVATRPDLIPGRGTGGYKASPCI